MTTPPNPIRCIRGGDETAGVKPVEEMTMDGWRTIESAPKATGSSAAKVLIIGGAWQQPELVQPDGEWWRLRKSQGAPGTPTHWMPIPAPSSALTPAEDEARLCQRLLAYGGAASDVTECYNGLRIEAAARIVALERERDEARAGWESLPATVATISSGPMQPSSSLPVRRR